MALKMQHVYSLKLTAGKRMDFMSGVVNSTEMMSEKERLFAILGVEMDELSRVMSEHAVWQTIK